jgi:hypothetical protein
MQNNPDYPRFTLVFDREGYSPSFFKRIWDKHCIAVLTYRKNVKDNWEETTMKLHEEEVTLDGYTMGSRSSVSGFSSDKHRYKIPVAEIPLETKYSKLNQESKYLTNIIKMICYRAETAMAHLLSPHYSRADDEVRSLIKAITLLSIDLMPDYVNNKLNIYLYPPANNRSKEAFAKIIDAVNKTNTLFPATKLLLIFDFATF